MTYADGEKVTYNYNAGGLLRSMTGKKKGSTFNYVNQLGYEKFEQRVHRSMRLAQSGMATREKHSYYSLRSDLTGLRMAARRVCKLIVLIVIANKYISK